jgi:hypothetical protein
MISYYLFRSYSIKGSQSGGPSVTMNAAAEGTPLRRIDEKIKKTLPAVPRRGLMRDSIV